MASEYLMYLDFATLQKTWEMKLQHTFYALNMKKHILNWKLIKKSFKISSRFYDSKNRTKGLDF